MISRGGFLMPPGGSVFTSTTTPVGNNVILAAGSNVRGLIVRRLHLTTIANSLSLSAKVGALASAIDGDIMEYASGSVTISRAGLAIPVAAGKALQFWSGAINQAIAVGYDIL